MYRNVKVIAMDLDGTLTQHKTPLSSAHRDILTTLSKKYKLLMVGAGQVMRIFNQLEQFPIDIIGNYGMQYGIYNKENRAAAIELCDWRLEVEGGKIRSVQANQ